MFNTTTTKHTSHWLKPVAKHTTTDVVLVFAFPALTSGNALTLGTLSTISLPHYVSRDRFWSGGRAKTRSFWRIRNTARLRGPKTRLGSRINTHSMLTDPNSALTKNTIQEHRTRLYTTFVSVCLFPADVRPNTLHYAYSSQCEQAENSWQS